MTKKSKKKNIPAKAAVAEEAKSPLVELDDENSSIVENEESSLINDDIEGPTDVGGFTILGDFKAKEKKIVSALMFSKFILLHGFIVFIVLLYF